MGSTTEPQPAGVEALVREMLDREEIRDLASRYVDCVWRRDVDGVVDLFAADASKPLSAAALGLALRKAITSPEQEARNMGMGQLCYAHYQAGQDTAPIYAKAIADRGITCTPDMIQMEHDAANRAADRVRRPLSVTCTESRIGNTVSTTCR